ncbi:hypothetical protein KR100_08420 [Synechococcus sp. KORDI-100]|uniref:hypothetical protein n=1 Tax=Synechococcus sp. KORDI-100 TaxID=1280380 RepID=UPI0004E0A07A|nr:hypothetical protein [Synechococcus sp. KORDI-100]AII43383.1 hypothetical protein KR100_08420 [Synechococcus sp. KORDI-100]
MLSREVGDGVCIGGGHPKDTNHTPGKSMAFKAFQKPNVFSTFKQKKEFEYQDVKVRNQEFIETASAIALKSIGTNEADYMSAEETFDGNLWGLKGSDHLVVMIATTLFMAGLKLMEEMDNMHLDIGDDRWITIR